MGVKGLWRVAQTVAAKRMAESPARPPEAALHAGLELGFINWRVPETVADEIYVAANATNLAKGRWPWVFPKNSFVLSTNAR